MTFEVTPAHMRSFAVSDRTTSGGGDPGSGASGGGGGKREGGVRSGSALQIKRWHIHTTGHQDLCRTAEDRVFTYAFTENRAARARIRGTRQ